MVMAWSVDRLGRSLQDLVGFLSELHASKIDLFLHQRPGRLIANNAACTPGGDARDGWRVSLGAALTGEYVW
jgi:hypothetical protein